MIRFQFKITLLSVNPGFEVVSDHAFLFFRDLLSNDILVIYSFFNSSYDPLQKWVDFIVLQQRMAVVTSVHLVFHIQITRHSNITFL